MWECGSRTETACQLRASLEGIPQMCNICTFAHKGRCCWEPLLSLLSGKCLPSHLSTPRPTFTSLEAYSSCQKQQSLPHMFTWSFYTHFCYNTLIISYLFHPLECELQKSTLLVILLKAILLFSLHAWHRALKKKKKKKGLAEQPFFRLTLFPTLVCPTHWSLFCSWNVILILLVNQNNQLLCTIYGIRI